MSVKLSVVIITFNEEQNIERCIKSVQPIADEIVILDSFSTDRTEEICSQLGAKFYQHVFDGHIEQKNRAITHASNDYILSLDADECPSEDLVESIKRLKNNWTLDGYYINRITNFCGRWIKTCGWYPDRKLRLFKKGKGEWAGTNPHDRYETFSNAHGRIEGDLLHYSFPDIDSFFIQQNKFALISANAYFKQGKRSSIIKIVFKPMARFLRDYFIKGGITDGLDGLTIASMNAYSKLIIFVKLYKLQQTKQKA